MLLPFDHLNKIQLFNIYVVLDAIVKEGKLSKRVSEHCVNAATVLMSSDDNEKKLAALNLYSALKCTVKLIQLSKSYNGFPKGLKKKIL